MKKFTIVLGTKNPHKVREIRAILRLSGRKPSIRFIPLSKFKNIPDVNETGQTYLANATKKALVWARFTGRPVLAEDSGIEVKALNWKPGIYSARYASLNNKKNAVYPVRSEHGRKNNTLSRFDSSLLNASNGAYKDNNQKLLDELKGLPESKRIARYKCVAVIAAPSGKILARTEGVCWGRIALKPTGRNGFGYDPIFIPKSRISNPESRIAHTFGQLPSHLKHRLSHRGIALRKIFGKITCKSLAD